MKDLEMDNLWVARDYNGHLYLHFEKPHREGWTWQSSKFQEIQRSEFQEVTWDSQAQKVKLVKQ